MKFSVLIVVPALLLVNCDPPLSPKDTPPVIVSAEPAEGAVDVPVASTVVVTFSETIDPATVSASTFFVTEDSVTVPGTVSASGRVARFQPSNALAYKTSYTATITTGITDEAGNPLAADHQWSFETGADLTLWRLEEGYSIKYVAVDSSGVYVAGSYPRPASLGGSFARFLVAKFSLAGKLVWLERPDFSDVTTDLPMGIAVEEDYLYTLRAKHTIMRDGDLYVECFDAYDGTVMWSYRIPNGKEGLPWKRDIAVRGRYVYVSAGEILAKLDAATGAIVDTISVSRVAGAREPLLSKHDRFISVAPHESSVYVGGYAWGYLSSGVLTGWNPFVASFDPGLDAIRWIQHYYADSAWWFGGRIALAPEHDVLYLAGSSDDEEEAKVVVLAYDLAGRFRWATTFTLPLVGLFGVDVYDLVTDTDGAGYIITGYPGRLIKVLPNGNVAWVRNDIANFSFGISVYGGVVFIASYSEKLLRYDAADGTLLE